MADERIQSEQIYPKDAMIDVDELGDLLKRAILEAEDRPSERLALLKDSNYRKCVRIYDFLRYANCVWVSR